MKEPLNENKDALPLEQLETAEALIPERFPIVVDGGRYHGDGMPQLRDGVIVFFEKRGSLNLQYRQKNFNLSYRVAGFQYELKLQQSHENSTQYSIDFRTKEYEYAVVDLTDEQRQQLGKVIHAFIESVAEYNDSGLEELDVWPAHASYTVEQIEQCIAAILESPKNELSYDELLGPDYRGFRIFDYYAQLFDKDFLPVHYNDVSRAEARARFFRKMIGQALPEWEIDRFGPSSTSLYLRRKKG